MAVIRAELEQRAGLYAERHSLQFVSELGFGVHGIVWAAARKGQASGIADRAIKVHEQLPAYEMERDVYFRLSEYEIDSMQGLSIPTLIRFDNELLILEIEIVRPPYLLDFAGCHLDFPPDYPPEVMETWEAEKREQFGPLWREVQSVLRELESYRIFLSDVTPNNLKFE